MAILPCRCALRKATRGHSKKGPRRRLSPDPSQEGTLNSDLQPLQRWGRMFCLHCPSAVWLGQPQLM